MFKSRKKKGFTLIEMVIVVAIIGILAGLIVPNVVKNTDSAKIAADRASARTVLSAINLGLVEDAIKLTNKGTAVAPIPVSVASDTTDAPDGVIKYLPAVPSLQVKSNYVLAYYEDGNNTIHIVAFNSADKAADPVIELYPVFDSAKYK